MALKVDYVLKETGTNLTRNLTLTVATVVTIAVSLAFTAGALLIRQGVGNATLAWKGDVELKVFMDPAAADSQIASVQTDLTEDPQVKDFEYFDHDEAYAEFRRLFEDQPEFLDSVAAADLPTSFRVVPRKVDFRVIDSLKDLYGTKPGVQQVVAASDTIREMQDLSGVVSTGILILSAVLALACIGLTFNTIRMAMFARRREIEVMKLVGATNWFIRVPFMLEGLVQGVVGSVAGVGAAFALNAVFRHYFDDSEGLRLLASFVVDTEAVWGVSVLIFALGSVVGLIGSAIAVTRFLDV